MTALLGRGLRNVWPVMFLLGLIMLNRPFIEIFDRPVSIGGYPLLFIYLIGGWAVSIGVIFLYRHIKDRFSEAEEK